jgi:hypothetical protein
LLPLHVQKIEFVTPAIQQAAHEAVFALDTLKLEGVCLMDEDDRLPAVEFGVEFSSYLRNLAVPRGF